MKNLKTILENITKLLMNNSSSPRLDAELLIAKVFQRTRSWILANLDYQPDADQFNQLNHLVARRAQGEPMAYIIGYQEFWGIKLKVNADVLIPRPETEHLVEWVLARYDHLPAISIADLGTGSGAIALALATERPSWALDATDLSQPALAVAKQNASELQLNNIQFHQGDWRQALPQKKYNLIISNPPYVAEDDPYLPDLKFEPRQALCAGSDGLDAIRQIISQTPDYLAPAGYLILEHGYNQANEVMKLLRQNRFSDIQDHPDLAGLPRFATARFIY